MESRMEHYEIMEQIGRGAFGAAILVNHKQERKKAAMFALLPAIAKVVICKSLYNFSFFINLTAKLKFNNAFDRAELMKKANGQYFPEELVVIFGCLIPQEMFIMQKLLKWFTQILLAVEYLHSNFVLHRDLKVRILLSVNIVF
ncbi:hypothetical protein MTR67_049653 [Solanum verrucosum]|uniref:Protein kinase domain-containing protein n=1 Tax=Solanum verrucosum TaxID=315347 RepID=A0AAF1A0H0_SOLVR|nr:hypothetical protein MTR67_049653 [Solanum verrucosum]